jgi:predicted transcriptional regulator
MIDDIFDVLAAQQRRAILLELLAGNPASDHVETAGSGGLMSEVSEQQASLYHNHLPKLEREGFIRWDRDEHVIEKGPRFSDIQPMLELLDDHPEELPGDWP